MFRKIGMGLLGRSLRGAGAGAETGARSAVVEHRKRCVERQVEAALEDEPLWLMLEASDQYWAGRAGEIPGNALPVAPRPRTTARPVARFPQHLRVEGAYTDPLRCMVEVRMCLRTGPEAGGRRCVAAAAAAGTAALLPAVLAARATIARAGAASAV